MKKLSIIVVAVVSLAMFGFGCKKKEQQPVPQAPGQMQGMPGQMPGQPPHGNMGPKTEKAIVIPDDVKGKWKKVVLIFEDKTTKKTSELTVKVGSEAEISGTGLKVAVGDFLPEFIMSESKITSASNEPKNPAVRVEVFENQKSIFKGWLYSKYPTVHPFEHGRYNIILKEGLKG